MKSATWSPGLRPANEITSPGLRLTSRATCAVGRAGSAIAAEMYAGTEASAANGTKQTNRARRVAVKRMIWPFVRRRPTFRDPVTRHGRYVLELALSQRLRQ